MVFSLIMILFCFYVFFYSSLHVMMVLLILESFVLLAAFNFSMGTSWFSFVMLILVSVCLGSFGISSVVSNSYSKSFVYFSYF
uniref:NADH dehydrogenase subunit 4L n=1 Tax=Histiostoma feroniarum TaxID=334618 RepID=A0A2Z4MAH1_9ACAR|nr:NADH dehydrogenase subunit 4L [Histiostoma feroniarum]AWX53526.1 NADH dehydrogenase subunit 4L [Histiostoma feroniarum]